MLGFSSSLSPSREKPPHPLSMTPPSELGKAGTQADPEAPWGLRLGVRLCVPLSSEDFLPNSIAAAERCGSSLGLLPPEAEGELAGASGSLGFSVVGGLATH